MDDDPGNLVIGWIETGEWLRYTVDVSEDVDRFDFKFMTTSGTSSASVRVVAGATDESDPCGTYQLDLSGPLTGFPSTSAHRVGAVPQEFDTSGGDVDGLPAGPAVVWLCIISEGLNLDSFELLLPPSTGGPYNDSPAVIPGVIEAEFFDTGGEGFGYHDKNPGQPPAEFRTDEGPGVVEMDDDPGNFVLGWIEAGEWLRYTVDVSEDVDRFDFKFVTTIATSSASVRVVAGATDERDPCGTYQLDLSGPLTGFPTTSLGGRAGAVPQEFDTSGGAVDGLPAGPAVVWLCIISEGLNVDSFELLLPTPEDIINTCFDPASSNWRCFPGDATVNLSYCGLTDDDLMDIDQCFVNIGLALILSLDLTGNYMTRLQGFIVFRGRRALQETRGLLDGLVALEALDLADNALAALTAEDFAGLPALRTLGLSGNPITTVEDGVFDNLPALESITLVGVDLDAFPAGTFENLDVQLLTTGCTELDDPVCPAGETCCVQKQACEAEALFELVACGDPHMVGFRGQKFDFTGVDGGWYCLIKDAPRMQISMRVSATVPGVPQITYITGLSLIVADADGIDHTIVIEVKDPHNLDSACPGGVFPCLADGALSVVLDGEEVLAAPGSYSLAPGLKISAANLPGACRSFGFEKYWERKKLESQLAGRMLLGDTQQTMGEWILGDPTATNMNECTEYVAAKVQEEDDGGKGVFAHQSEHASFMIVTPDASIRLSHGRLHQLPMRDPTDQFDLPDHLTWQMNFAVDHRDVSRHAKGILGETFVPTLDAAGNRVMHGMESIRGTQEDYRVDGPLGTAFAQDK